jgi:hypothetical protein
METANFGQRRTISQVDTTWITTRATAGSFDSDEKSLAGSKSVQTATSMRRRILSIGGSSSEGRDASNQRPQNRGPILMCEQERSSRQRLCRLRSLRSRHSRGCKFVREHLTGCQTPSNTVIAGSPTLNEPASAGESGGVVHCCCQRVLCYIQHTVCVSLKIWSTKPWLSSAFAQNVIFLFGGSLLLLHFSFWEYTIGVVRHTNPPRDQ